MASVCAFLIFQNNFVAAQEVAEETLVSPSESNEGELKYGELVDYFVTAERIPTHRMDTPANVTVITAAEIEANHYQTLAEALSHVVGARISNANSLFLSSSGHVLILIDGIRLNQDQGMIALSNIARLNALPSMKMIERIEIVKGASSALYGTNAAAGVVNIITKKGTKNETTLDVNYGTWHTQNYEFTNQGTYGEKFSWFFTGAFRRSDNYQPTNYGVGDDTDKTSVFSLRLDNRFDENNSLTLSMRHLKHKSNDAPSISTKGYSFDRQEYNGVMLSYNFKEKSSTPGWLRYFNNYEFDYLYTTSRMQGIEYQNGWEIGQHKIIFGAEYHTSKASSPLYLQNIHDGKMKNIAAYVQDTISLGDKWTVIPGVRLDYNKHPSYYMDERNFNIRDLYERQYITTPYFTMPASEYPKESTRQWSPKLAVNYRADDKNKIYISWGKIFRAPTIGELYADTTALDFVTYGIASLGGVVRSRSDTYSPLVPETGHSEIIGFEHDFDKNTALNISLFNRKLKNVINWPFLLVARYNWRYAAGARIASNDSDAQKQRGIELSFNQKVNDNFSYDVGYIHTHMPNNSGYRPFLPNGYYLGLHYTNGKWKANLLGLMASGLDRKYNTSGSYAVFDFNTSYDINENATIYARLLNFTDENYAIETAEFNSYGRSFMAGAQFKF